MTILFAVLMIAVFGKLIGLAVKAAWGITKIIFSIVFCPLVLIGLFVAGLVYLAVPILVIIGILALIASANV